MPKNWTAEEHAKLLVALIKTGKPKVDTAQIAAYLDNGRSACAVYFEIRRLKMLAEGGLRTPVKKRQPTHGSLPPSPDLTPVKAEPRPTRATKPSAAKRRYDEIADSGFWDDDDEDTDKMSQARPVKRAKSRVKFEEQEFESNGAVSGVGSEGGIESEA